MIYILLLYILLFYDYIILWYNFAIKFSGNRIEDLFYEKIDKKKPNRLNNLEYVGHDMIEAGNDFGPGLTYG
jgi:hypothetical protein